MGLFFLPTLLVCSFSGCGNALLTGGLKTDSWDKMAAAELLIMIMMTIMSLLKNIPQTLAHMRSPMWDVLSQQVATLVKVWWMSRWEHFYYLMSKPQVCTEFVLPAKDKRTRIKWLRGNISVESEVSCSLFRFSHQNYLVRLRRRFGFLC